MRMKEAGRSESITRRAVGVGLLMVLMVAGPSSPAAEDRRADTEAALPVAPRGTRFHFEIIESCDARYLGDTPAHSGKDGGLTVRPQVALGDPVYRSLDGKDQVVGRITRVAWSRVSGSLEVEFHPEPLMRIAVGDEVWIDLNPATPSGRE
jgi:hypothetical protein